MKMLTTLQTALLFSVAVVLGEDTANENISPGAEMVQTLQHQTNPRMCHPDMCAILAELGAIKARLTAAEDHVQELERENTVQGLEIQALRHRSNFTEAELREHSKLLEELGRAKPKVAFAAALGDGGQVGPSNADHILRFQKLLTNVGSAYNPSTGVFIVPVRGVYYISYSTFTIGNINHAACSSLFRNDQRLVTACDHASQDYSDTAGNGATLLLEKGDHVYVMLHAHSMVYDDKYNRSCFRGFLLFQM